MSRCDLETLKARIADAFDPDVLVDMLDLDVLAILDRFEDVLVAKRDLFSELDDRD